MTAMAVLLLAHVLGIYLFSWFIEWVFIKRVLNNSADGFMVSIILAGVWICVVPLFTGDFTLEGALYAVIATAILLLLHLRWYLKRKAEYRRGSADVFE